MSIWERIKILSEHHVLDSLKVHSADATIEYFEQFGHTSTSGNAILTHEQSLS